MGDPACGSPAKGVATAGLLLLLVAAWSEEARSDVGDRSLGVPASVAIDQAVDVLNDPSSDYRRVLQELLSSSTGDDANLVSLLLGYSSNALHATVCARAATLTGDSVLSECSRLFVATGDPDRAIEGILGNSGNRVTGVRVERATVKKAVSTGPVRQWTFAGFDAERQAGSQPEADVQFAAVRVITTETEGCVSPVAYREAKRANALSAAAVRRLDRQLQTRPREVQQVRPRFAPPTSLLPR